MPKGYPKKLSPQQRGAQTRARNRAAALKIQDTALAAVEKDEAGVDLSPEGAPIPRVVFGMLKRRVEAIEEKLFDRAQVSPAPPTAFAHSREKGWEHVPIEQAAMQLGAATPALMVKEPALVALVQRAQNTLERLQRLDSRFNESVYRMFGEALDNSPEKSEEPPYGVINQLLYTLSDVSRTLSRLEETATRLEDKL